MKSAIRDHLRRPRTCPARRTEGFQPPYPAWMANGDGQVEQAVIGYFGVQSPADSDDAAAQAMATIVGQFGGLDGPAHVDHARYIDRAGYQTSIAIAYWTDPAQFDRWLAADTVAGWWNDPARLTGEPGCFREIFSPDETRFETLFSNSDQPEGLAAAIGKLDAEDIREHSYWGSMRDRIAAAQTDPLEGGAAAVVDIGETRGRAVRLPGRENLAVIRSGQDWSATRQPERRMYLEDIEPALAAGMAFLSSPQGAAIGCLSNRYMQDVDAAGAPQELSFGLSYWRSLGNLESWAASHPTHLAIFNGFLAMAGALDFRLALRLYHEVLVLTPEQQQFEYFNCHPGTGMLARD